MHVNDLIVVKIKVMKWGIIGFLTFLFVFECILNIMSFNF